MLVVSPKYLSNQVKPADLYRIFRFMLHSRLIVTSDEIKPSELFLAMRRAEKAHPRGKFAGLCEKVVIFLEKEDFEQLINPPKIEPLP
jgi:hypothetical protein